MRQRLLGFAAAICLCASSSMAQDFVLDSFETYADETAMQLEWAVRSYTARYFRVGGGAAGTSNWMEVFRQGYTMGLDANDLGTPPAGNYKVTFNYKNGQQGQPWQNLTLTVKQGVNTRATINVGSAVTTGWTLAESAVVAFTNEPVTVSYTGTLINASDGYWCALDELKLVQQAMPVTVSVAPDAGKHVTKTVNLTASVTGGSGTYTNVTFDVGADGSIEGTDNAAPYQFTWNTLTNMAQGTSGTISLRVIATDSASATGQYLGNYTVDNRGTGFTPFVTNGDFSGGWAGTGNQIPNGWVEFSTDAAITNWGPAAPAEELPGHGACLKIVCAGGMSGDEIGFERYKIRSAPVIGLFGNLQASCYSKGPMTKLFFFTSPDGGNTWVRTTTAAVIGETTWSYITGPIIDYAAGYGSGVMVSIAPHVYLIGDYFYDDISAEGIELSAGVDDWRLY